MTDTSFYADSHAGKLDAETDELNRAIALLDAASIIVEHMHRSTLSKAETNTLNALGTCLNAVDDILEAVVESIVPIADTIRPPEVNARMEEAMQREVQ